MTYDPPFCPHCQHEIADDWDHDAGCPIALAAIKRGRALEREASK